MNHIASPDHSDPGIERQILAKGLTAPRVTPADIEANIVSEIYFTAEQGAHAAFQDGDCDPPYYDGPLSLLTFCVLVLRNGFTVTGESARASPENFDAEIGRNIARTNAVQKIWPLMGLPAKGTAVSGSASMKRYIGTKTIHAAFVKAPGPRGHEHMEDGYTVIYPDGYTSWSPKDVFEQAYRACDALNFGLAIEALRMGHKVQRAGWNGKGLFVYYVPAASYPVQTGAAKSHFGEGSMVPYNAYLAVKNVDNSVSTWAPSINDVLADDWRILE